MSRRRLQEAAAQEPAGQGGAGVQALPEEQQDHGLFAHHGQDEEG